MKKAYVTPLYNRGEEFIVIHNGFSFFEDPYDGDHFYPLVEFDSDGNMLGEDDDVADLGLKLSGYDKIFCTISMGPQLEYLQSIIDNRWVLGGPFFINYKSIMKEIDLGCEVIAENWERRHEPRSKFNSKFNQYWMGDLKSKYLSYTCSLGGGCYWSGKCTFCAPMDAVFLRGETREIISQLKEDTNFDHTFVNFCYSATPLKVVKEIVASLPELRKKRITAEIYIRADKHMVDYLTSLDQPLYNLNLFIGLETFSNEISNKLGKGTTIEDTLRLLPLMDNGLGIMCQMMGNYPYMTESAFDESMENMKKFKRLDSEKLFLVYNSNIYWGNKSLVDEYCDEYNCVAEEKFMDLKIMGKRIRIESNWILIPPKEVQERNKILENSMGQFNNFVKYN